MNFQKTKTMKLLIEASIDQLGIHHWPEAVRQEPRVAFLTYPHAHIFKITCVKQVSHDNRDIELLLWREEILQHLKETYPPIEGSPALNFDDMSCEAIAVELFEHFDLEECRVAEDNFVAAIVKR